MSATLWLTLSKIPGVGSKTLANIYKLFPNLKLQDIAFSNEDLLHQSINNKKVSNALNDREYLRSLMYESEQEISNFKKQDIEVVSISDHRYPDSLREIESPPPILYCRGNLESLNIPKKIAVIGTRRATPKGRNAAAKVASVFVSLDYVIVSGLAEGIDTAGHLGALEAQGKTIAILPGGVDAKSIYPAKNKALAEKIVQGNGLLVSEYPPGSRPYKASFVQRDRLQSGMSLGVCPVQTDIRGGTQHTIKFSRDQKRILFCPVPSEDGHEEISVYKGIHKLMSEEDVYVLNNKKDYKELDKIMSSLITKQDSKNKKYVNIKEISNNVQEDLFNSNLKNEEKKKENEKFEKTAKELCDLGKQSGFDLNEIYGYLKKHWYNKE